MQTDDGMAGGKGKHLHVRISEDDEKRLALLMKKRGMHEAELVRALIAEAVERIATDVAAQATGDEDLQDEHFLVHYLVSEWFRQEMVPVHVSALTGPPFIQSLPALLVMWPHSDFRGGVSRVLDELQRWGYVRARGQAYVPTKKKLERRG